MKKLTPQQFDHIESWILRHARPLEAARYSILFGDGRQEDFLALLSRYQNSDGGFGHALEPDNWDPHSSPYTTLKAVLLMLEIGFADFTHPLYQGAISYLRDYPGEGWPFSTPTANDHPHAPWWTYSEETNGVENLGLSAQIAAFALMACHKDDPLYRRAQAAAQHTLDALMHDGAGGEMGVGGCAMLMPYWMKAELPYAEIAAKMMEISNAAIVRDPARWNTHVPRPSAAISSPESPMYAGNEEAVHAELDWLVDTLPDDDLWPIDWSWFDNNARYPAAFAISEMWWKAWCAIEKLSFLRSFDRLP